MTATDGDDVSRSFLASEENFRFLKELESQESAGPGRRQLRRAEGDSRRGQYLKDKGALVSAFYLSNVEMYLMQDGLMGSFCRNVATLPLDETSTLHPLRPRRAIRPGLRAELGAGTDGGGSRELRRVAPLRSARSETARRRWSTDVPETQSWRTLFSVPAEAVTWRLPAER